MAAKNKFSSRIGVIAATVGSAVGLGTVWRFPNEVQDNGGSVFLLAYLFCVLLMGIPVMLAVFVQCLGLTVDRYLPVVSVEVLAFAAVREDEVMASRHLERFLDVIHCRLLFLLLDISQFVECEVAVVVVVVCHALCPPI